MQTGWTLEYVGNLSVDDFNLMVAYFQRERELAKKPKKRGGS